MTPNQLVDVVMMLFTYVGMSKMTITLLLFFLHKEMVSCKNNNFKNISKVNIRIFLFFNLMLFFKNIYLFFIVFRCRQHRKGKGATMKKYTSDGA